MKPGYKHILVGMTLALALAGCANGKQANNPPVQGNGSEGQQVETPQSKQEVVKAYYADNNLDKLIEREATISYNTDVEKYQAALQLLKVSPESTLNPLSKGITVKSLESKNGNLVIDISIADEGRLGAPGEMLLLEAFKKSLFQFDEVQTFDLLIDGKKAESLMGHMSLMHPFKRGNGPAA